MDGGTLNPGETLSATEDPVGSRSDADPGDWIVADPGAHPWSTAEEARGDVGPDTHPWSAAEEACGDVAIGDSPPPAPGLAYESEHEGVVRGDTAGPVGSILAMRSATSPWANLPGIVR